MRFEAYRLVAVGLGGWGPSPGLGGRGFCSLELCIFESWGWVGLWGFMLLCYGFASG